MTQLIQLCSQNTYSNQFLEMGNKLVIAAAGSGKTTMLISDALAQTGKVLITTFTQANELEIRNKIIQKNGCIPEHIIVQTWFSFLMQHGVRPFQGKLIDKKVKGLILISGTSAQYIKEATQFERHFFSKDMKIYSDKLSKFVVRSQEKSQGALINRLTRIYTKIYIDEVQDLSGYDLDVLKLLFASSTDVTLVGDPRQGTYSTSNSAKNKQFKKSEIAYFFQQKFNEIETDDFTLTVNYRSIQAICQLSNQLFTNFSGATSGNQTNTEHDGIFFVRKKDVESYLNLYNPLQLRENRKTEVHEKFNVMNFGESKGLTFERVLIYPTKPIIDWILNNSSQLAPTSRSKFYVALTRAKQSVGIIYDFKEDTKIKGITNYQF